MSRATISLFADLIVSDAKKGFSENSRVQDVNYKILEQYFNKIKKNSFLNRQQFFNIFTYF